LSLKNGQEYDLLTYSVCQEVNRPLLAAKVEAASARKGVGLVKVGNIFKLWRQLDQLCHNHCKVISSGVRVFAHVARMHFVRTRKNAKAGN